MLAKTHLAFGFLAGLLALKYVVIPNQLLFVVLVAIGVLLPDIDHSESRINRALKITRIIPFLFRHRGFFHSVFAAVLVFVVLNYWLGFVYGFGLFVGYASHLLSDALTVSGVNFLHPVSNFRISGPVKTGSLFETVLFVLLVCVNAWLLLR